MPISGYFDTPFGIDGELVVVPDGVQIDGSVSYNQGWTVNYTLPSSNPSYKFMPWGQFNQIFYDMTSALQYLQQNSAPAFITSTMNGGTAYSYPKYACVNLAGVNYISLQAANTDTPPTSKWAIAFGGISGSFTAGHIAVFADTYGTIQDGGAVPSAYTLPAATTSVLGGVIPDGTIITVDGSGHITVPTATPSVLGVVKPDGTIITNSAGAITVAKASNTAFGVVEVDNTTITASAGVISIPSNVPLPGNPTTTTQSSSDNTTKIATTAMVQSAITAATPAANVTAGSGLNPTGTSSATQVMMGLAKSITPTKSGDVLAVINGTYVSTTGSSAQAISLRHGTGSAPTNGAAVTGTADQNFSILETPSAGSGRTPFTMQILLTGLTLNTALWFDLGLSTTGGTATLNDVNVSLVEIH